MKKKIAGLTLATLGACLLMAAPARAGSLIWAAPSSCNSLNCASNLVRANVTTSSTIPGGGVEPFIIQVLAGGPYCTRFDVSSQNVDLEIVIVSPNGTVWRNDDRPGSLRPLAVIPPGVQGWYTVQLSPYNGLTGSPGVHYNGDLLYGRYVGAANVNCANLTPASLTGNMTTKGMPSMPRAEQD